MLIHALDIEGINQKPDGPQESPASTIPRPPSGRERVLQEAGLPLGTPLHFARPANIETLTTGLLDKGETKTLVGLQATCDVLTAALETANELPGSQARVVEDFISANPGAPIPESVVGTAANAGELRRVAKNSAKRAARAHFDSACVPAVLAVFTVAAEMLREKISERVIAEREAHAGWAKFYDDSTTLTYSPSPGLLALVARRIQLLDQSITPYAVPNLRQALSGVLTIP